MIKIFLSYSTEDANFVVRLSDLLTEAGIITASMQTELSPGKSWRDDIYDALVQADAVVVVVSEASINSRHVQMEISVALGSFQESGRPLVIPIVLDNVQIPPYLSEIQAIISPDRKVDLIAESIVRSVHKFIGMTQAQAKERRELQQRVETNAADYISKSIGQLKAQERRYRKVAYVWYSLAFFSLLLGLGFAAWRAFIPSVMPLSWQSITHIFVLSLIVIGLLGALSRFAFILGKSFMVESLRNSDRIHAISFGEFYLRAYGEYAERSEIKEAFQHWNIDKGSSFIHQTAKDVDPEILSTAIEIAKVLRVKP